METLIAEFMRLLGIEGPRRVNKRDDGGISMTYGFWLGETTIDVSLGELRLNYGNARKYMVTSKVMTAAKILFGEQWAERRMNYLVTKPDLDYWGC